MGPGEHLCEGGGFLPQSPSDLGAPHPPWSSLSHQLLLQPQLLSKALCHLEGEWGEAVSTFDGFSPVGKGAVRAWEGLD